jgi:hypothetical protein
VQYIPLLLLLRILLLLLLRILRILLLRIVPAIWMQQQQRAQGKQCRLQSFFSIIDFVILNFSDFLEGLSGRTEVYNGALDIFRCFKKGCQRFAASLASSSI